MSPYSIAVAAAADAGRTAMATKVSAMVVSSFRIGADSRLYARRFMAS